MSERLSYMSTQFEKVSIEFEHHKIMARNADQRARLAAKDEMQRVIDRNRSLEAKLAESKKEVNDTCMQLRKVIHDSSQEKSTLYATIDEKAVAAHEAETRSSQYMDQIKRCKKLQRDLESNESHTSQAIEDLLSRLRSFLPRDSVRYRSQSSPKSYS